MLDINLIREKFDEVRDNLAKRNNPQALDLLNDVIKHDEDWRVIKTRVDELRHSRNTLSKEINKAKKEGRDAADLVKEAKNIPLALQEAENKLNILQKTIRDHLLRIPNLLHKSVPEGKSEKENKVIKTVGEKPKFDFKPISHVDLLEKHDWADLERAAKISGARWYFLKGELAQLEMALTMYAVEFMVGKGHTLIVPPFAMNRKAYDGVIDVAAFSDTIYKLENEDLYLIGTSEHPLTAQYMNEVIDTAKLPLKLVGYSTNFRREAGAHGKDQKGIFRVHQFNKVEQVIIAKPEDSWKYHEELVNNASEFLESLGICHQHNVICSGDIGDVPAKTIDLDAWFPVQDTFKEIGSESNCTDYQARRLNLKCEDGPGVNRRLVHTLNGTCIPTSRAIAAILENFQQKDGSVVVPKVLQKYLGKKVIGK